MKKTLILIILLMIPIVLSLEECPRFGYPKDVPCEIRSTWKPTSGCFGNITFFNESGTLVFNSSWSDLKPYCRAEMNYSDIGTICANSTIEDVCITIQGDDEQMILAITLFLLGINIIVFALPFWVRFSKSEAGDYVVKRMFWIASILLLWFNTTLFRTLAESWGLGIDNFLIAYWWIFTIMAFGTVLVMCYVMVAGAMKLMKEAQLKKRMGEDGY